MTDDAPANPPARPGHRSAPDDVWARVKQDYLDGWSAPACCRRHGVGLSALRMRAGREGWRRSDQPWTPPHDTRDPDDEGAVLEEKVGGNLDKVELCELAYVAHRRMMRAVMRGDATEALRWRRVRLVIDAEEAELRQIMAREEEIWRYLHGPDGPDDVHDVHADSPSPLGGEGGPQSGSDEGAVSTR